MHILQKLLLYYPKRVIICVCCAVFILTLLIGKVYLMHLDTKAVVLQQRQALLNKKLQDLEKHLRRSHLTSLKQHALTYSQTLDKIFDLANVHSVQIVSSKLINTYKVIGLNKNQLELHLAGNYHDFISLLQSLTKLSGTILSWRDISIQHGQDNKLNMFINLSVYNL